MKSKYLIKKKGNVLLFVFIICNVFILSTFKVTNAYQKESPFEIALVPSVSPFNFSYHTFVKGNFIQQPKYTKGLIGSTGFYWGLGLQFYLWNEWTATFNLSQADIGGGFKAELMHGNGHVYSKSRHTGMIGLNQFSLNVEKELWRSKSFNISNIQFNLSTQILLGLGINKVGNYNLTNSHTYSDYGGLHYIRTSKVINQNSGAVNIGWTNQIYINNKQSLKLGILYSYGFRPIEKEHYNINYFHHDAKDEFTVLTGKHSLLLYAAYPIVLYRNKAQRDFVGKKRRTRKK